MSSIKQLEEIEGKLNAVRDRVAKAFEEATVQQDGASVYDFTKVRVYGEGLSTTAVAEKVRADNQQMDELGKEAEALRGAADAAAKLANPSNFRHPGNEPADDPGGHRPRDPKASAELAKALGEQITGTKAYKDWVKQGCPHGITVQLEDLLPSDAMAKAGAHDTMRSKTLMQTSAGWAPESLRIGGFVEAVTRPLQLLDIIPLGQTMFEQVVYMEETTRTHAAAETGEGIAFQESTFALTERTSPVRKITDSLPVTDEQLEDVPMVSGYINGRLVFGLRQRLDRQVLLGDGTGQNLTGIKNVSGIQTQAKAADPIPDAFFKAMRKIRVTGRAMPTHHVIHPEDWESVRLLRTADGLYIWGNPSEAGPERMWGLPVVQQDADAAGTGYVGSFNPAWISLFERRGIDVQVGFTGTQFTEGKRTVRGDMRFAFVVFRPAAFCTVTGL